jgi:predicted amidohydrolase
MNADESKDAVRVEAWSFDVGNAGDSVERYCDTCVRLVEESWNEGADIVLLPEYTWAGLEPILPAGVGMEGVARVVWEELLPALVRRWQGQSKVAVLGTAPWFDAVSGLLHNRSPIFCNGKLLHQDKLFLTPWETAFSPGETLHIFETKGLRFSVVICLDIEVPELSALLRGQNIDLLLVPSATETFLGSERVTRCASARSVELCCGVIVSPLVGRSASELIDVNVGRLACYLPSQSAFKDQPRLFLSDLFHEGFERSICELQANDFCDMRQRHEETNPAQIINKSSSRAILLEQVI